MNTLWILLRCEFFVGLRSGSGKLLLLAPTLLALCQLLIDSLRGSIESASGGSDVALSDGAYGYFVDGISSGLILLSLMLVATAAYSLSSERDNGSIRHLLIRRADRLRLLAAKFLYLLGLAAVSTALLLLCCYLISGLLWEFGPVSEEGFVLITEQEIREEIALGLRLALLPLPAAIGFGLLIAMLCQSASQALTVALGITLALDLFKTSLGDWSLFLYLRFLPALNDLSYLADVSRLVRGYSDVLLDERILEMNQLVPLPSLLVLLVCAALLLRRKTF